MLPAATFRHPPVKGSCRAADHGWKLLHRIPMLKCHGYGGDADEHAPVELSVDRTGNGPQDYTEALACTLHADWSGSARWQALS